VTLKPETEAETEALTIQAEARPRPRPSELETETRPRRTNSETEPRHYCASGRSRDRAVETETTSHIDIIPSTDVVLKRSGGSLELTLNRIGIFKHNFIYVMLNSTEARPRRGTTAPRDGLETEVSRPRPHP